MWVKEKLLGTTNFSFSHSVYKRLVSQGRQKVSLCWNGFETGTVKPVLETTQTTCIKRQPALRDHHSDTTTLLKST